MTSRRGTLVEEEAYQLLRAHGYTVTIRPFGIDKRLPPAHLIGSNSTGETRLIRIQKISSHPVCVETIEGKYMHDIVQFRKYLVKHPEQSMSHCEIWTYSLCHGFRLFEIHLNSIREIPKRIPKKDDAVSERRNLLVVPS